MTKVEAVAAIIRNGDEILCLRRGPGRHAYTSYKYEFPGGKVEPGESRVGALRRELNEEMGIDLEVREEDFLMTVVHAYPDFELTLHCYVCPVADRAFRMNEHTDARWLPPGRLSELDWAEADRPVIGRLGG